MSARPKYCTPNVAVPALPMLYPTANAAPLRSAIQSEYENVALSFWLSASAVPAGFQKIWLAS